MITDARVRAMKLTEEQEGYWRSFCEASSGADDLHKRLYGEVMKIGSTREGADLGAKLILDGTKTATSGLEWEIENGEVPCAGMLNIVVDGLDRPVCIVETTSVEHKAFGEVDEDFARSYGEWERTLDSWREGCREFDTRLSSGEGRAFDSKTPLVCERFELVFPKRAP